MGKKNASTRGRSAPNGKKLGSKRTKTSGEPGKKPSRAEKIEKLRKKARKILRKLEKLEGKRPEGARSASPRRIEADVEILPHVGSAESPWNEASDNGFGADHEEVRFAQETHHDGTIISQRTVSRRESESDGEQQTEHVETMISTPVQGGAHYPQFVYGPYGAAYYFAPTATHVMTHWQSQVKRHPRFG